MSDVITTVEQQTIIVSSDDTSVVETTSNTVVVAEGTSGPQGIQGTQGPQGQPGTNGAGDKSFSQAFFTSSFVTVTHNLGKYPSVLVIDSAGDQCEGDVDHLSTNQLTVTFAAGFSGTVICN